MKNKKKQMAFLYLCLVVCIKKGTRFLKKLSDYRFLAERTNCLLVLYLNISDNHPMHKEVNTLKIKIKLNAAVCDM